MLQTALLLRRPPRLVVRLLATTFGAMALVLVVVFVVLIVNAQGLAARAVAENLEVGRHTFLRLEAGRAVEIAEAGRELARRASLGEALTRLGSDAPLAPSDRHALMRLLATEIHELADRVRPDAVAVVDATRRVVAGAGRASHRWQAGQEAALDVPMGTEPVEALRAVGPEFYRVVAFPVLLEGRPVGEIHIARTVDAGYAHAVSRILRGFAVVVSGGRVVASTLDESHRAAFDRAVLYGLPASGVVPVNGEPFAVLRVLEMPGVMVYAVDSIREASRASIRSSLSMLLLLGGGAMLLGAAASFWLSRSLSRPIGDLSRSMSLMAADRRFDVRLERTGSSRELDALTDTFNELMLSLRDAESQSHSAYVGAIKALAAALDARDPYTAGHSERVSALSVAIGRELALPDDELEVLRLGALLHDIGKIGVSDNVLRKPGPLTVEEFEAIKAHPRLGSRILKAVPFLAPHLPIVELHHERPDGLGYPHGLAGDEIPFLPRIVRVADAFDAITTARAYRPARPPAEAMTELWRGAGSQFDADVVETLVVVWPVVAPTLHRSSEAVPADLPRLPSIVRFPLAAGAARRHELRN